MILTFTHENKVDTGFHNNVHTSAEMLQKLPTPATTILLQLDNRWLSLDTQGVKGPFQGARQPDLPNRSPFVNWRPSS